MGYHSGHLMLCYAKSNSKLVIGYSIVGAAGFVGDATMGEASIATYHNCLTSNKLLANKLGYVVEVMTSPTQ